MMRRLLFVLLLIGCVSSTPVETTLSGRVTNYDDGTPVAGADVNIQSVYATTDANGEYFVTRLSPGRHTIIITRRGFTTFRREIDLRAGENRHDVELIRR